MAVFSHGTLHGELLITPENGADVRWWRIRSSTSAEKPSLNRPDSGSGSV